MGAVASPAARTTGLLMLTTFNIGPGVVKPKKGATHFRFYDPKDRHIAQVGDDLSGGDDELLAEDSAESCHRSLVRAPLAPLNPTRSPDYQHINWVLVGLRPPDDRPDDAPAPDF